MMKNLKDQFLNLSIRRKITYLYLPLTILPILAYALFSMNLYEGAIVRRSLGTMDDNTVLIADRVESILDEMDSCATLLTISINNLYRNEAISAKPVVDVFFESAVSNELAYAKLIFKDIDSIAYIDEGQKLFMTDQGMDRNFGSYFISDMRKELRQNAGNNQWFPVVRRSFLVPDPNTAVLTLAKKIWNIDTGETLGYLFINVNQDTFAHLFGEQQADYFIVNSQKAVVATSMDDRLLTLVDQRPVLSFLDRATQAVSSEIIPLNGRRVILSQQAINRLGWTLLGQADLSAQTQDLNNLLALSVVIVATIIILEIAMSVVLNRLITDPIMRLKEGLEQVSEGQFDLRFNMKTQDEIGLFAKSFNRMSVRIQGLIHQVEQEEKKKSAYELALIQQQIKPHFLYNTLDIILKLSQMGQSKKAQKATRRLADYYKSSLSGGADIISIREELKITKDYLELQKIRYSDVFTYDIQVDDQLLDLPIPKLTLQPLVENAIYHGLKYKETMGTLFLVGTLDPSGATLAVVDNGVGIPADHLATITDKRPGHFGLYSVNHRLNLLFSGQCSLTYESDLGQGTRAKIVYTSKALETIREGGPKKGVDHAKNYDRR